VVSQQLALLAWWFFDHCVGSPTRFVRHPVLFPLAPVIGEHLADLAPWVANCLSTPSRMVSILLWVTAEKAWPVRLKMRYPQIMVLHRFPHWMCISWGITLVLGRTHIVLYYCNPMKSYYICRNNWWKIKKTSEWFKIAKNMWKLNSQTILPNRSKEIMVPNQWRVRHCWESSDVTQAVSETAVEKRSSHKMAITGWWF